MVHNAKNADSAIESTFLTGAQKRTRTSTSLRTLHPECSASTNSAIWANVLYTCCCLCKCRPLTHNSHWGFQPAGKKQPAVRIFSFYTNFLPKPHHVHAHQALHLQPFNVCLASYARAAINHRANPKACPVPGTPNATVRKGFGQ